jgi:hypothetical protein
MARPMRAAGLRHPKAIGVRTLILVFTVDQAVAEAVAGVAWMLGRWLRIFSARWVNSGIRQREAHDSHRARAYLPASPLSRNGSRSPSLRQVGAPEAGVGFLDPGELGFLAAGEVLRVLPPGAAACLRSLAPPEDRRMASRERCSTVSTTSPSARQRSSSARLRL